MLSVQSRRLAVGNVVITSCSLKALLVVTTAAWIIYWGIEVDEDRTGVSNRSPKRR